jgi:hypothetical protein
MKYLQTYNLYESQSFDSWFSGSKVVDDNGDPLIVYHGSKYEITELYGGMYFTDDYMNADGYAGGEYVYEAFLSIKKPLVLDCDGNKWDELESVYGSCTQEVVSNLDTDKYDGVIFNNIKDSWIDDVDYQEPITVYYCISSSQIRSTDRRYLSIDLVNPPR